MSADWAADIADRAMHGDVLDSSDEKNGYPDESWPEETVGGSVQPARSARTARFAGQTRARVEPPLARSVGTARSPSTSSSDLAGHARTGKALTSEDSESSGSSKNTSSDSLMGSVKSGDWLSAQTFPPLQFAVPGIVPAGFTVLAGPPKAGKSWLLLDWLISVAMGRRPLGSIPAAAPRPVLYLALEDSDRRMQERCSWLLQGPCSLPAGFAYCTRVHPQMAIPLIAEFLHGNPGTGLVAIDTLGRILPSIAPGDTVYQRDYKIGAELQSIAERYPGLGVVAAHHTRKTASADFVDSVSGTNGLAGAADTVVVLARDRNTSEGTLHVTGRDIEEAEYSVVSDRGRWVLDGADLSDAAAAAQDRKDGDSLSGKKRDLFDYASQHPEGIRAKEAAEKFGNSVYADLRRLVDDGHLEKIDRGLYVVQPKGKAA